MQEFDLHSTFTGFHPHVLITLSELGSGPTCNYEGVLTLITTRGYKTPERTLVRSRLNQIPDILEGVAVNIPFGPKELKWMFRHGRRNHLQTPTEPLEDILFPASTLWLLEVVPAAG